MAEADTNQVMADPNEAQAAVDASAAARAQEAVRQAQEQLQAMQRTAEAEVRRQQSRFAAWRLRQQQDLHNRSQNLRVIQMQMESQIAAHAQARAQELAALEERVQQYGEGVERATAFTANPFYTSWTPGGGTALTLPVPSGG